MNIQQAHDDYGWPDERRVLQPSGGGPAHLVSSAAAKIGGPLSNFAKAETGTAKIKLRTGLLCANPEGERTEAPLAVVCEFNRHVSLATLREAHRLAWNFSHAPLLVTLEPNRVLVWSCNVPPSETESTTGEFAFAASSADFTERLISCEITRLDDPLAQATAGTAVEQSAIQALHWVNLLAGRHFQRRPDAFKPEGKLDSTLIRNLLHVRNHLHDTLGLGTAHCHDLLARLIFVQFLFQRKDSKGRAALHREKLHALAARGTLRKRHDDLVALLADHADTYRFFEWLNERFNGDLFPGKGATVTARKREWAAEKTEVRPEHLDYLSRFIDGKEDLPKGQKLFWSSYAFDTIPLELISSIYELFVGPAEKNKAYYTRGHLVDFMLDAVLPWQGDRCDLRVLDPSCGSGIFLVKAFQRLVHRWKQANGDDPKPSDLKAILSNQVFGVDIDPEAIRVASFSLYLALCDELDPRHYWTKDKLFPRLRDHNLIASDFFAEDRAPFRTAADAGTFDLVIGNAPWGKSTAKDARSGAQKWAQTHDWPVPRSDHGPVFLAKAAHLAKPDGWVSMIQPGGLLLNRETPVQRFRKRLFSEFTFEEVINLAAVRRELFATAIGPACVVTFKPKAPEAGTDFAYVTPKPIATTEDGIRIAIEPHDIHFLPQNTAASNNHVWSVLMWGGNRDLALIERISRLPALADMRQAGELATREGVIRGDRKGLCEEILGRRFLPSDKYIADCFLTLRTSDLPINEDPEVDARASKNFEAFEGPQLIFKQSWSAESGRFSAFLVKSSKNERGIICTDSYVSVRDLGASNNILPGLWLTLRSRFATYWFALVGGKFAGFVPTATESEFRQLPALRFPSDKLPPIAAEGYAAIDRTVLDLLDLSEAERILVEDLHQVVLPDAQRQGGDPPGRIPVSHDQLDDYAHTFRKVLQATFGEDRPVSATIYHAPSGDLPLVQLVAIHLDWKDRAPVQHEPITTTAFLEKLHECHELILQAPSSGIGFQRVVEVFSYLSIDEGQVPTLYLIKPAQRRYWLRSLAMRDADRLGSLLLAHHTPARRKLTEAEKREIHSLYKRGLGTRDIAEKFNVSPESITQLRDNKVTSATPRGTTTA
jgi:hypothetical protein